MKAWKSLQNKPTYSIVFLMGLALFLSSLQLTIQYVPTFETREGIVPYDPFMTYLPAIDVSFYVFFLLYGAILLGSVYFIQDPRKLLTFAFSFGIMYYIRALCITLVPLNEPTLLIPLSDPLIEKLGIYQTFIKRDLFFSGHFASVFIPYLILRKTRFNWVLLMATIGIGILVMVQHIHYSYDVFGAIIFTYLSYYLADKLVHKLFDKYQF
jgi:membrane-associated phospholipid phosphatase